MGSAAADGVAELVVLGVGELVGGLVELGPGGGRLQLRRLEQVGAVPEGAVVGGGRHGVHVVTPARRGSDALDHVVDELALEGRLLQPVADRLQGLLGHDVGQVRGADTAHVGEAAARDGRVVLGLDVGDRDRDVLDLDVRVLRLEVLDDLGPDGGARTAVVVPEGDLALPAALRARTASVVAAGGGPQGQDRGEETAVAARPRSVFEMFMSALLSREFSESVRVRGGRSVVCAVRVRRCEAVRWCGTR